MTVVHAIGIVMMIYIFGQMIHSPKEILLTFILYTLLVTNYDDEFVSGVGALMIGIVGATALAYAFRAFFR